MPIDKKSRPPSAHPPPFPPRRLSLFLHHC
jgi:hypothetical protein